ncbi:alpha/beta fold hydrolase [Streptomyces sp. NRRL B-1347]|uniref:alpha/beta fold hydrolase n=1 Tax=Streptomyces sp. NRRL B-1347 TaxID=1476877 RepID=UPI001F363DE1|nr:alpha/beta hydrolase [Streptomyces sp. NRRL B-1347]
MRDFFTVDQKQLSFLDFGGPGRPLLAFHGHTSEASTFAPLAEALAPQWRVIALDQRGHGESDRAQSYQRADYVADIAAFHRHLGLGPVPVLGHSMGGVNAFQYAARHAGQVTSLIIEDIGAVMDADWSMVTWLPLQQPSREALTAALGELAPYLECTFREFDDGWSYSFDIDDTVRSHKALSGTYWNDWESIPCPTLLIRGADSVVLARDHAREMIARRDGQAQLVELPAGHVVHADAPEEFAATVRTFLAQLPTP